MSLPTVEAQKATITPHRVVRIACIIIILLGIVLRFSDLGRKIFWTDEVYTSLRVSGYTQGDLTLMFDQKTHPIAQITRLQTVNPDRGMKETTHSLVVDDPQHPPLFYVAERIWAAWFGADPATLRALAACFSVITLAAAFWFMRELVSEPLAAWIATALIAVSPFHLVYAHEAREYSLWTFALFSAAAALVRAVRLGGTRTWLLYAGLTAFSLYADLLSVYVIAAESLWAFFMLRKRQAELARMLLATALGVGLFGIWIVRIWAHWQTLANYMSWGAYSYPIKQMAQKWVFNTGAVLFDLEYANLHLLPIALFAILVLLAGAVIAIRSSKRPVWSLLLLFGGVITLAIVVQDFRTKTYYSTIARYLTPLWLMLECMLAIAFTRGFAATKPLLARATAFLFTIVLIIATWSGTVGVQKEAWWDNHINADARELADVVNAAPRPLIITTYRPDAVLVLSHYLKSSTTFLLFGETFPAKLPDGFGSYFLLSPTNAMVTAAEAGHHFTAQAQLTFMDNASPVEQFHESLRKNQAARGARLRYTPQEFLVPLQLSTNRHSSK